MLQFRAQVYFHNKHNDRIVRSQAVYISLHRIGKKSKFQSLRLNVGKPLCNSRCTKLLTPISILFMLRYQKPEILKIKFFLTRNTPKLLWFMYTEIRRIRKVSGYL